MKKFFALMLALVMALSLVACGKTEAPVDGGEEDNAPLEETKPEGVMSYEEYMAAEMDTEVTVDCYVQAHQSWWDGKITVYAADEDGAYFIYEMACDEADAALFDTEGLGIRVTGFKSEWAGEIEIVDATYEILSQTYEAEALDATALLGTDELIAHQNQLVSFKGMTVEAYDESGAAFAYKNAEEKSDDLYFKVSLNGETYEFCVEYYLCGSDTDVYKAVEALEVGQVIDVEGFLYWYEGANPHVTSVTVVG